MKLPRFMKEDLRISEEKGLLKSEFPSVQKLLDYLQFRETCSEKSIIMYCWSLNKFRLWACSSGWVKLQVPSRVCSTPDDFIKWNREELETVTQRYLDEMRSRSLQHGLSVRYLNTSLACLKRFFRVNGFCRENNNDLRIQSYHQPARVRNKKQYVPTLSEACKMAERAGNKRNRAIIQTLMSSGLRNTSLRALQVKDIVKEIEEGQQNLLIKIEPEWNRQRIPGSCKGGIFYYTFTSTESTRAIVEMLNQRKVYDQKRGIDASDSDPLFMSGGVVLSKRTPLSAKELQEIVKNAAREADIPDWKHVMPHSLRKVFESVLRSILVDGTSLDAKDQEWLMGHVLSGSQDAYYDWTKINRLREQFAKLLFEDRMTPDQQKLKMNKQLAVLLDIDVDKLKADKEKLLDRKLLVKDELELMEKAIKKKISPIKNKKEQKIVPKMDLAMYLNKEWAYVGNVDEKSAIVERSFPDSDMDDSFHGAS